MTSIERRIACARALAAAINDAGGMEGRVRLQKTLYLLKRLGVPELKSVDYVYYHYGPYSAEIAEVLQEAVAAGVCIESGGTYDDEWQKYSYQPSPQAGQLASELPRSSRALIDRIVNRCKNENWRTLELAATMDFVRVEERLTVEAAEERALALKPACRPYVGQARQVLSDIGLTS